MKCKNTVAYVDDGGMIKNTKSRPRLCDRPPGENAELIQCYAVLRFVRTVRIRWSLVGVMYDGKEKGRALLA
jgi:hypothetical protein